MICVVFLGDSPSGVPPSRSKALGLWLFDGLAAEHSNGCVCHTHVDIYIYVYIYIFIFIFIYIYIYIYLFIYIYTYIYTYIYIYIYTYIQYIAENSNVYVCFLYIADMCFYTESTHMC